MVDGGSSDDVTARQNTAVRAFLAGDLDAIAAADAAGMAVSELVDLVERLHAVEDRRSDPDDAEDPPDISVVLPVYDEEANLPTLLERLVPVLEAIGTFEVVVVDDHSHDGSRQVALTARAADPRVKLVELSRNFGHQAALAAGLDHARGRAVVLMDADLQDPPELLAEMADRWREGYEVVFAVRTERKEGPILRACFYLFYRVLRLISDVEIPADSGDFCLMDRKVVDALRALPESNRFLRGLRSWVGFRQVAVRYERAARLAGHTKYSSRDRVRFAVDGLLSFSDIPLRLASLGGFVATAAAVMYLLWAIIAKVTDGKVPQGWTSIIFVQLLAGGVQLIILGITGAYLARTYQETKRRPAYVVGARHGARALGPASR